MSNDLSIKDYELKSKWRVLPKQFGEYRGEKILEIEQICVGTKTMAYQEYLNCRNYSFIAKLLGHHFFSDKNDTVFQIEIETETENFNIAMVDAFRVINKLSNIAKTNFTQSIVILHFRTNNLPIIAKTSQKLQKSAKD